MTQTAARLVASALACAALAMHPAASFAADRLLIAVSIPPQKGIVDEVCADLPPPANVSCISLMAKGSDPHSFEPTQKDIVALSKADIYLLCGMPFEEALLPKLKSMNPAMIVVPAPKLGFARRTGGAPAQDPAPEPEHGHRHEHRHGGNPHTWVSEAGRLVQMDLLERTLLRNRLLPPECSAKIAENSAASRKKLLAVNAVGMPGSGSRVVVVYHPAYEYLCDEFGIEQIAFEHEGGEPALKRVRDICNVIRKSGVKKIVVQNDAEASKVKAIAGLEGMETVIVSPMSIISTDDLVSAINAVIESSVTKTQD